MEETVQEILQQKDEQIEAYRNRLEKAEGHIRMQTAYITLLEASLRQYNILLDVRDGNIITRQFQQKES